MSWTVIPNPKAHQVRRSRGLSEELFLRVVDKPNQPLYLSSALDRGLGDHVRVSRNGHRFLLEACSASDDGARAIYRRYGSAGRFRCKELRDALDNGRIYVEKVGEGRFEL